MRGDHPFGLGRRLADSEGASLVEFAVALPLLVVLVVGIFDFGGAFNLKQELNNAVREGARYGASLPSNDLLNSGTPPTVDAIRFLVDSYLQAAKINDCGLSAAPDPGLSGPYTWNFTASGCASNLVLKVERGVLVQENVGSNNPVAIQVVCTRVTLTYPYQWRFNSVIQLLVSGANYGLTSITSSATSVNMD
jgi:Flp pilus assembly protein TadG